MYPIKCLDVRVYHEMAPLFSVLLSGPEDHLIDWIHYIYHLARIFNLTTFSLGQLSVLRSRRHRSLDRFLQSKGCVLVPSLPVSPVPRGACRITQLNAAT
jgi:hypothetical protein